MWEGFGWRVFVIKLLFYRIIEIIFKEFMQKLFMHLLFVLYTTHKTDKG